MKRPLRILVFLPIALLTLNLVFSCNRSAETASSPLPANGQTVQQLHLPEPKEERMIAAWIPYFTCEELFSSQDLQRCRNAVMNYLSQLVGYGVNTVFVHVCAFGESCYPSKYYPRLHSIDEMQVFTEICSAFGISLHAWINPLRLQTDDYMNAQTGDSLLHQWYTDAALRRERLSVWDGRYYLNPASETTAEFLTAAVTELIEQYHPSGIHIDDYFYPTDEPALDSAEFAASGAENLADWRRSNITGLIRKMHAAAHSADPDIIFSISPQGNLLQNYDTLFADVYTWAKEADCCDLLIPQIYFGYRNEICPFSETVSEWLTLPRAESVSLAVGLAAYKVGAEDPFAGDGLREWITESGLLARQTEMLLNIQTISGIAYYHSDALLTLPDDERAALTLAINTN